MKIKQCQTPWGNVDVSLGSTQFLSVKGETDMAVFYGQGYGAAKLRLWQLDLSRRVAGGRLSEIMGNGALRTDIFQRRLGLRPLAERAEAMDAAAPPDSWQGEQYQHIKAYVAGLNQALQDTKLLPAECLLLGYRPEAFTLSDTYLLGQLKYFINSAWQYELFHTRLANRLTPQQHQQLLITVSQEQNPIPPLPLDENGEYLPQVIAALKDGLKGLRHLGLASPDTGSNVIAVSGKLTRSGKPMLAADPHMGHVNPGFNLMCKLESDEGLSVFGSHFPGSPGIIVGRNPYAAWGMVGIMADNQDMFWGRVDLEKDLVETVDGWIPLNKRTHIITTKKEKSHTLISYDFPQGQMMSEKNGYAMFLRWPALDDPSGDITFYRLAKCRDWNSFRASLEHVHNSPMMVGYADIHGDIGLQSMGYIPQRERQLGSLLQSLTNPEHQWRGYVPFDQLPQEYNPPCGYSLYANQYSEALFAHKPAISNRWHPPSRAWRIEALLQQTNQHDFNSLAALQDDKVDIFAQKALPILLTHLLQKSILHEWDGDTRHIQASQLFDIWMQKLADKILGKVLRRGSRALYSDFWPGCRWNLLNIVQYHSADWLQDEKDLPALIQQTYDLALNISQKTALPQVAFQHSIKRPQWLNSLFTAGYPYQGGNRETIHATRQNADFLTQSQAGSNGKRKIKPYTFGPGFKLICSLDQQGECQYASNTPAKGSPFFWQLKRTLKDWQSGKRQHTFVSLGNDANSSDKSKK